MKFTNELEYYVYEEFNEIAKDAYLDKIRYFRDNETPIHKLPLIQSIEIQCDYIEALYQTNSYYQVLKIIDEIIECIISENIFDINGTDVYKLMLFVKADCLYNTIDYKRCNHIASELIKIEGDNILSKNLFVKNKIDNLRYEGQIVRAISILLIFASAFIISIEILAIRSFYKEWIYIFAVSRNVLFLSGLLLILGQEILIRIKSFRAYTQLIK